MFVFSKPSVKKLEDVLRVQSQLALSYLEVGWTAQQMSPALGYHIDAPEMRIGFGELAYDAAVDAMINWRHFNVKSIGLFPSTPCLETGTNLIVYARHYNIWSINACRIVYIINDKTADVRRFGYGYGTLPEHAESGEERFLIEWDLKTDEVRYKIFAFSRPNQFLVSLFWPIAIQIQDDFRLASLKAMRNAVNHELGS